MRKKAICLTLAAMLVLLAFGGCSPAGGGADTGDAGAAPEDSGSTDSGAVAGSSLSGKDTLVVALEDEIESLDPYIVSGAGLAGTVLNLIYEPLFAADKDSVYSPVLVESYNQVDDLTWEFKLKEGILFHNGDELTSADVKATLEYSLVAHPSQNHEKEVEIVDDYNFIIRTPEPDPFLIESDLVAKWNMIAPKSVIDAGEDFATTVVGTGPYRFADRATAEYISLASFEGYRSRPETDGRVENITFRIIPESSSRTISLETGEVDIIKTVENMDIDRLMENPDTQVLETTGTGNYNITLNTQKAPLDNINLRKAIAHAVNPESAMLVTINGQGYVNRATVPEGQLGHSTKGMPVYDPELARQYLAEAGYGPGELTLEILGYSTQLSRGCESIQADLAEIGINVTISNVEAAVMMTKASSGDYDMILLRQGNSDRVHYLLDALYNSKNIGGSNRAHISVPEIDALLNQIASTTDQSTVEPLYVEVSELIQETYSVLPLFIDIAYTAYRTGMTDVHRNVQGVVFFEMIRFE